jgi:NitT/TauT family transport system substrate-binding protein
LTKEGKTVRAVFVQDHTTGLKLLAGQAWYVRSGNGQIAVFLLRASADDFAKKVSGQVSDYASVRADAAQAVAAR